METIRKKGKMATSRKTEIVDLPVDLIKVIISLTSRRDACRSALVSREFRSASDSDDVWKKFLSSDCRELISQSATIPEAIRIGPKKDLYFYLCNNPIRIGNGNMSFAIHRESGKMRPIVGENGLFDAYRELR